MNNPSEVYTNTVSSLTFDPSIFNARYSHALKVMRSLRWKQGVLSRYLSVCSTSIGVGGSSMDLVREAPAPNVESSLKGKIARRAHSRGKFAQCASHDSFPARNSTQPCGNWWVKPCVPQYPHVDRPAVSDPIFFVGQFSLSNCTLCLSTKSNTNSILFYQYKVCYPFSEIWARGPSPNSLGFIIIPETANHKSG